jgi:hypothetical protein
VPRTRRSAFELGPIFLKSRWVPALRRVTVCRVASGTRGESSAFAEMQQRLNHVSCPGRGAAPWRCAAEPGPTLRTDGSRSCAASLRAASRPGHEGSLQALQKCSSDPITSRAPDAAQRPSRCDAEPGPTFSLMGPGSAPRHCVPRRVRDTEMSFQALQKCSSAPITSRAPDAAQRPSRCDAEPGPTFSLMGPGPAPRHFVPRRVRDTR